METGVSLVLAIAAGLLTIPAIVVFLEVIAAIALTKMDNGTREDVIFRGRIAILVPAHNESTGLLPTLGNLKAQVLPGYRLLVIADNCTDDTAKVAAAAGADVIERHDSEKVGKGFALDWGLQHLTVDPPDVVVMVDADCHVSPGAIDHLAAVCLLTDRPVQALDLMIASDRAQINQKVAEFAWRVKNWVRPLGLKAVQLPCHLMGTGMAFPWSVIRSVHLASGSIVEDLKLGLDLTLAGKPPLFCPAARVTSRFPTSVRGAEVQRRRWEQGHFGMMTLAPQFLYAALAQRNLPLMALTFDLLVPPLSSLILLILSVLALGALVTALGLSPAALIVSAINFATISTAILVCWFKYGRDVLPAREIWLAAPYLLSKLQLYVKILCGKRISQWVRTDRGTD